MSNSIAQTDPRYKNGVFTNARGQREDRARLQQQRYRDFHPLAHGWTYSYWHDQLDLPVYSRNDGDGIRMVYDGDGEWVVQFLEGDQISYSGTMAEITAAAVAEERSRHETRCKQDEWEIIHPDPEIQEPF